MHFGIFVSISISHIKTIFGNISRIFQLLDIIHRNCDVKNCVLCSHYTWIYNLDFYLEIMDIYVVVTGKAGLGANHQSNYY